MRFTTEYRRIPLDAFRDLPGETWSERFFRAGEYASAHVDARAAEVLAAIGAAPGPEPRPAWEAASAAGVRPERMREFRWLLLKLARSRHLEVDDDGNTRAVGPGPGDPREVRAAALAEDPALAATLDLIDAAAEGWPAFLRGEREGTAILFNPRTLPLWERYFSKGNPVYAASNLLAGHAAARALGGPGRHRIRILEVGGGLGSGAEALLEALGVRPGDPDPVGSYLFTELSPGFLRRAEARLTALFPAVPFEFRVADVNRTIASQGIPAASVDLAYAVNTLHVARDLVVSLGELRRALVPGGWLAIAETIRPAPDRPVAAEFVFQLLREFREFRRDPECRPHGGFLEWSHWRAALARAGFLDVRTVPDFEAAVRAYPEHSIAAIVGRAPDAGGRA